jgi:tetratricopeptide (TPR) repeat protein
MATSYLGDFSASIETARAVVQRAETAGDAVVALRGRVNLGFVLNRVGRFEEAHETLERALQDARSLRTPSTEGFALHNLGMSLARLDDLDGAIEHERLAEVIGEKTSHFRLRLAARLYEALFLTWRGAPGDLAQAHTTIEAVRTDSAAHPISYLEATAALAQVQLARNKLPACLEACEDAFARLATLGSMEEGEEMLRLVQPAFPSRGFPH